MPCSTHLLLRNFVVFGADFLAFVVDLEILLRLLLLERLPVIIESFLCGKKTITDIVVRKLFRQMVYFCGAPAGCGVLRAAGRGGKNSCDLRTTWRC